jgi:glycosyltransferase involved in cell wall biosynthesis
MFNLPATQVLAIPLSTNETEFTPIAHAPPNSVCTVLFVGTLIPLHGIAFILDAISRLAHRQDIGFRLVGDGQESAKIAAAIKPLGSRLVWVQGWQSSAQLAAEIANADICLGIFGEGNKTQRVCPFKLYAYAAMGRATITGDTQWLRESGAAEAFASVPVGNGLALANRIASLAESPVERAALASASRAFYEKQLSNAVALEQLVDCLRVEQGDASPIAVT